MTPTGKILQFQLLSFHVYFFSELYFNIQHFAVSANTDIFLILHAYFFPHYANIILHI